MMCLSTNPFHALKSFEESKRFRALQNRGPNLHSPSTPSEDPLQELSAVIGDWKEGCLKYGNVLRTGLNKDLPIYYRVVTNGYLFSFLQCL